MTYANPQLKDKKSPLVQAKLTIGQPGDKYEQEADAMADQVMRMPQTDSPIQRKCEDCEEESLQMKPLADSITPIIQKQSIEEAEGATLQMKSEGGGQKASASLSSQLSQSKGGGTGLPTSTNQQMSAAFGADFSGVRIHTDSNAVQMNRYLNARAFTHGSDVYFNKGEYSPGGGEGKRLLAHELTHVVQQGGDEKQIQRAVEAEDVSCQDLPRTHPVFTIISEDPTIALEAASARGVGFLNNLISELESISSSVRGGEPPAFPIISDCLAMSLRIRMRIDPGSRESWTGRGPGTVAHLISWLSNIRNSLGGGHMKYTCLGSECEANDYGYMFEGGGFRIYLCRVFWEDYGVDDRALALIHETAHIYYNTIDTGTGPGNSYCIEHFVADANNINISPRHNDCRDADVIAC